MVSWMFYRRFDISNLMFTEATTIRPRNGASAESYWRIRYWCEKNGFTLSDVINAVMVPLAYYLENHCQVEKKRNMATVELNAGFVDILHVFGGKCYPLATSQLSNKPSLTLPDIQKRIDYWKEQNKHHPTTYDLLLLNTNAHAQEKLKIRRLATSSRRS